MRANSFMTRFKLGSLKPKKKNKLRKKYGDKLIFVEVSFALELGGRYICWSSAFRRDVMCHESTKGDDDSGNCLSAP